MIFIPEASVAYVFGMFAMCRDEFCRWGGWNWDKVDHLSRVTTARKGSATKTLEGSSFNAQFFLSENQIFFAFYLLLAHTIHKHSLFPLQCPLTAHHEYFEKSSALNFGSPPTSGFCVFPHTKKEHAIALWEIKILKSLSPLDNFSDGFWTFIISHTKTAKKYFLSKSLYQLYEPHFKFLLVFF